MRAEPGRLNRRTQESAGRALAVGAGNMKDGREILVRIAEAIEQRGDAFEAENISAGESDQSRSSGRCTAGAVEVAESGILKPSPLRGVSD